MAPPFEKPSFEALLAEQEQVQAGKFQGRLLREYNSYIFSGQMIWREPRSDAVTDFVRPLCSEERVSLDGVIRGLCASQPDNPVHWVDMGGGRGLPMRQLATDKSLAGALNMTNVDLFDHGVDNLKPDEVSYLEELHPGMLEDSTAPDFIRADCETVQLDRPAELITSIETVQYLNNPLAAICNWYNQLVDGGLLIISAERDWSSWIRYQREIGQGDYNEVPTKHFLEAFEAAGIPFAACYESDTAGGRRFDFDPSQFSNLVVQKKPGTQINLSVSVEDVWVNPYDFKAVYYQEPADQPNQSFELNILAKLVVSYNTSSRKPLPYLLCSTT